METSDVPPGIVNIVTGGRETLTKTLAEHDDVDAVWSCGDDKTDDHAVHTGEIARLVESASVGNLKRTWISAWPDLLGFPDAELLRQSVQVKNIWTPYGA
jgi:aldehyde dehydrogenase (NAD+)